MRGVNHRAMNENNKYQILRALLTYGPLSRAQLCDYTQLSKMTITNLVNEYISQGVVEESGQVGVVAGRKPTLLRLIPNSLLTLGVFVARESTEVGILNLDGSVLSSERFPVTPNETVAGFLDTLLHVTNRYMTSEHKDRIWGIGISSMGPMDKKNGIILDPPGFHGMRDIPIVAALSKAYGIPTFLELESCVAALAELYFGNKNDYENFLYFTVNEWLGGSVVFNGRMFRSNAGLAGLIGGVVVERDDMDENVPMSGCIQQYGSLSAIVRWARENGPDPGIMWNTIASSARRGDSFCLKVIDRLVHYLETALVSAIAVLDPQCIYVSGAILLGEDLILKRLEESVNRLKFAPNTRTIPILPARYTTNAQFIGTTALVMEHLFKR